MAKKEKIQTPKKAVTGKIASTKKFDLAAYKKNKNLSHTTKFKVQEYLKLDEAFQKALSIPGLPYGHISLLRGHTDTSKTTAMVICARQAQKDGKMPVLVITEMKWSWDHAKLLGLEVTEEVDKDTGEIEYSGDFIYIDRGSLNTIEDVAAFISDLIDDQEKGILLQDLVFLWDSAGSIPCQQSYDSKKNNNMWNAGAMSTQFGNFINQRIVISRKDTSKFTNTLIVVNKVRVEYPISNPMERPKLRNKAGDALLWDATIVVTFGNITGPGTMKLKAKRDGKEVEWAKVVKVSCDKNHLTGIQTSGRIVTTVHGFIENDPRVIDKYKKEHSAEWAKVLGAGDFEYAEELDETVIAAEKDEE